MSQTEQANVLQAEAIVKLVDIVTKLIQSKQVTESELVAAKQEATDLVAKDASNASVVGEATAKIQQLIELAAASLPVPVEPPTEEAPV
ncbi:MAG: hypothetical protein KME29_05040 [Calothrix sp. FI2-JRJ7]|jgi:hypothetical protein|nr:hypothetical protein [Calothrix sp. FI2-JRJ7]